MLIAPSDDRERRLPKWFSCFVEDGLSCHRKLARSGAERATSLGKDERQPASADDAGVYDCTLRRSNSRFTPTLPILCAIDRAPHQ